MKNILILIVLSVMSFKALAGAGTYPQGDHVKLLKDKLEFKNSLVSIGVVGVDPSTVATSADAGSILIFGNVMYVKEDAGLTTNWTVSAKNGDIDVSTDIVGVLPILNGGTGSATQNFVDLTTDQSILGVKTFTGQYVAVSTTNGMRPCPIMTEVERDAIVAPSEGDCIVNSVSSDLNFFLASSWRQIGGGGSGNGVPNYIIGDNTDFEGSIGGWVTSHASLTLAQFNTPALRGTQSLRIRKLGGDFSGQYYSLPFTIETADLGNRIKISFDYDTVSSYVDNDYKIEIVKDPLGAATVIPVDNEFLGFSRNGLQESYFLADATELNYELRIKIASTNAAIQAIIIDNVIVHLDTFESFVADLNSITDWSATATPSITGTTSGTLAVGTGGGAEYTIDQRQVGDSVELRYAIRIGTSGAVDVVGSYNFLLPASITVDTAEIKFGEVIGYGNIVSTASGATVQRLIVHSTGSTGFRVGNADGSVLAAGGALFNNANVTSLFISAEVVGWSSGVTAVVDRKISLRAKMSASVDLAIPDNTDTQMVFAVNNYDNTGSAVDLTANSFVIPSDGVYTITPKALLRNTVTTSAPNNSRAFVTLKKNGNFEAQLGSFRMGQATNVTGWAFDIATISYDATYSAGDVLTFFISHNFGANVELASTARMAIREHAGSPTIAGVFGVCQTKFLSADIISTVTDLADLRFSNLDPSKIYELSLNVATVVSSSSAYNFGYPECIMTQRIGDTPTNSIILNLYKECRITGVTTLSFNTANSAATRVVVGNNTVNETHVTLCESNKGVTTKW